MIASHAHSLRKIGPPLGILMVVLLFLRHPQQAAQGFSEGLLLCANALLPALFPFFLLCSYLIHNESAAQLTGWLRPLCRLCGLNRREAPLLLCLSWVGGYAACAQLLSERHKTSPFGYRERHLLLLLGCCSSPGFVVGCLGGQLLRNPLLGWLLYGLQLAANFFACLCCLPLLHQNDAPLLGATAPTEAPQNKPDPMGSAIHSSLCVCGWVIFFRMLHRILLAECSLSAPYAALLSALLEISAGCSDFARLGGSTRLYGVCLCLSLLGCSVFLQLNSFLRSIVSMRILLISRLWHFLWLQILIRLTARLLPGKVSAFSSLSGQIVPMTRLRPDAAAFCFLFLCLVLYKYFKTHYNVDKL